MKKTVGGQYKEPLISRLKKKNITLTQKPLRLEEVEKPSLQKKVQGQKLHFPEMRREEEKPKNTPRVVNNKMKESTKVEREKSQDSQRSNEKMLRGHPLHIRRQFPLEHDDN